MRRSFEVSLVLAGLSIKEVRQLPANEVLEYVMIIKKLTEVEEQ